MKPKCLENAGSLAWSATGHLLPCCWYDNQNKKYISELVQDKFNLRDNTVQEVLDSEEWKGFIDKLEKHDPSLPLICHRYCG